MKNKITNLKFRLQKYKIGYWLKYNIYVIPGVYIVHFGRPTNIFGVYNHKKSFLPVLYAVFLLFLPFFIFSPVAIPLPPPAQHWLRSIY